MSWTEQEGAPARWAELEEWLDRTRPAPAMPPPLTGLAGPMALAGLAVLVVRTGEPRR